VVLAGLAGFVGLHRIYAGRYVTGLLQAAMFVPGAAMMWRGNFGTGRGSG